MSARSSPERRMPEQAAQQANLACMHHLVMSTPKEREEFRLCIAMRMRDGLVQLGVVQGRQLPKHLRVHPVQHRLDLGWSRVLGRVSLRHRVGPEEPKELLREQAGVFRLLPANAPKRQPVLGKSDMANLPADVADAAWRLSKPLGLRGLVKQPDGVVAGKDDLLND